VRVRKQVQKQLPHCDLLIVSVPRRDLAFPANSFFSVGMSNFEESVSKLLSEGDKRWNVFRIRQTTNKLPNKSIQNRDIL